ncbi:FG-GAP repeat domain-containing protein [Streptomyces sp. NPDC059695]|uniref:FG-GAP repeat domain-containing protein n=1 Tax=Streptomyces sp. NPDC059695 TaxID=3346910 RepID=UPI0036B93E83
MNRAARRIAAASATTGLLTVATVANSGTAAADANVLRLSAHDQIAAPGTAPRLAPQVESGTPDGKTVIAFSTKPLTGPAGDGAGVPKGFTAQANGCTEAAGLVAVYVCGPSGLRPGFVVPADASDTAVHWGFAYVPRGGDLAAGIEAARTAGATPADATHGSAKVVVRTAAHAALNTVLFDLPDVPSGGKVRQQLRVHAVDAGRVTLSFRLTEGQLWNRPGKIPLGNVTTDSGASCSYRADQLIVDAMNLDCRVEPGEHTISYELTASVQQKAVRLQAQSRYNIYDFPTMSSDVVQSSAPFAALGSKVLPRHGLLARDASGKLWQYYGTGTASTPFNSRTEIGAGWQTYATITSLSPYKQGLYYRADVKPSAVTRGLGDVVARDASGTLWYYDRQLVDQAPYAPRVKVGGGWNAYDRIAGSGDLDRDGFVDLLARDMAGVLWLYKGTGSFTSARFKTRVKIGGGWGGYNHLAGGSDLTGDGRADLLARDRAGVLWLYRGTGNGTAPYATRVRVGGGWGVYDQLVVAGDLTDDGKADGVACDRAGVLWLYRGTGSAAKPFSTRTRIGGGWSTYDLLL